MYLYLIDLAMFLFLIQNMLCFFFIKALSFFYFDLFDLVLFHSLQMISLSYLFLACKVQILLFVLIFVHAKDLIENYSIFNAIFILIHSQIHFLMILIHLFFLLNQKSFFDHIDQSLSFSNLLIYHLFFIQILNKTPYQYYSLFLICFALNYQDFMNIFFCFEIFIEWPLP